MKRYLALACLWPGLLVAQELAKNGGAEALQKWHEGQVAIGNINLLTRADRAEQTQAALGELERREQLMLQAYANVDRIVDSLGFDADYIKAAGVERRRRVAIDERSSSYLDSVRRTAEPIAVLTVLELRRDCVDRFAEEARTLKHTWKEMLTRWQRELDRSKGGDKANVAYFERLVNLGRGVVEFERKRAAEMKAESEMLARQIEAAKPQDEAFQPSVRP
jgi:hypothetical protein